MNKKSWETIADMIENSCRKDFPAGQRDAYRKILGRYPSKDVMDQLRKFLERPTPKSGYTPFPAIGDLTPNERSEYGPARVQCRHEGCKRTFYLNPDHGESLEIRNPAGQLVRSYTEQGPPGEEDYVVESAGEVHMREHPDFWGPETPSIAEWDDAKLQRVRDRVTDRMGAAPGVVRQMMLDIYDAEIEARKARGEWTGEDKKAPEGEEVPF